MRIHVSNIGVPRIDRETFTGYREDSPLEVVVVSTTPEGTLGALKAAGNLAKDLGASVGVLVTEVVPFRLPLDQPRVSIDFLTRRQELLVSEAGIEDEEVRVRILVCRDQKSTLRQLLPPRSLVIIGGRSGWWPRQERRLERFLSRLGHHVIVVDSADTSCTEKAFNF